MFIYNSGNNTKNHKRVEPAIEKSKKPKRSKKSPKSKKGKTGGRVKSLCKKNVKFLKSIGFKVKKNRITY